ncbi:hypothetical protein DFH08DRAFT_826293 [Mycena albidolilacea]|uniref:Secreted protein n=1 Tax=Mycena albidolilacea TaxID=1033008 RepID=A0AAD7E8H3_9AGAR|nr:hypothetical protein DFH08DRAFT_826293 [Mycena albidolilacea]
MKYIPATLILIHARFLFLITSRTVSPTPHQVLVGLEVLEPSVAAAASSTYTSEETSDTPSSSRPAGGDSGELLGGEVAAMKEDGVESGGGTEERVVWSPCAAHSWSCGVGGTSMLKFMTNPSPTSKANTSNFAPVTTCLLSDGYRESERRESSPDIARLWAYPPSIISTGLFLVRFR